MRVFLGVDTSSYTTSMCLLGEDGQILSDERKVLQVASGARGLRQSEALFQHVQNIPNLASQIGRALQGHELVAIGVSTKPRPQEDSYMPVFLPGTSLAESIGHLMGVPCFKLTHQETHIWGGIASARGPRATEFLAIHLSGGTTELARVKQEEGHRLAVELLGGTLDLHAGQFVDRLGVKIGLSFPAGPSLEELARGSTESLPVPTYHRDGMVSFSGPLTYLEKALEDGGSVEVCARACFKSISRTLVKWIRHVEKITECRELLLVGGVAANGIIRTDLREALPLWRLYFADPHHSVDNAYGAAYFAGLSWGWEG